MHERQKNASKKCMLERQVYGDEFATDFSPRLLMTEQKAVYRILTKKSLQSSDGSAKANKTAAKILQNQTSLITHKTSQK